MPMTRQELAVILGYAAAATGAKCGTPREAEYQIGVYFDMLGDLSAKAVEAAVKQVLMDHPYPSLPPVGAIRKAAVALQSPPGATALQAWELFRAAVRRYGSGKTNTVRNGVACEIDRTAEGLASLPPRVARAAKAYGWQLLCDTRTEDMGKAQHAFLKAFDELSDCEERRECLPPSVAKAVNSLAQNVALALEAKL